MERTSRRDYVGAWANEKLNCLQKYLDAYTTILKKQEWCRGYIYVDAFAGAVTYKLKTQKAVKKRQELYLFEEQEIEDALEFIKGSPIKALEIKNKFTNYIFVEKSKNRCEALKNLKKSYPRQNISIKHGDCNKFLVEEFLPFIKGSNKRRAVIFLDPYGMHVPWSTIEKIAATKKIEIFINFPYHMAIQRLLLRNPRNSTWQLDKLDSYFGCPEWRDIVYLKTEDMFGEQRVEKNPNGTIELIKWYRNRLKAAFGYASTPRLIRSSKNRPLYFLIFAGPNKTGNKIADHILKNGETI